MTDPPEAAFDPTAIIAVLLDHDVRFVVVGGFAAGVQGAMYATTDLDVCYGVTRPGPPRTSIRVGGFRRS